MRPASRPAAAPARATTVARADNCVRRTGTICPLRQQLGIKDETPPEKAGVSLAENGGFEPPRAFTQHAFQACAIGH